MAKTLFLALAVASIGILIFGTQQGRQLVAEATAAVSVKPVSGTQQVLRKMKQAEQAMQDVLDEQEFLKTVDTTTDVDVDSLGNSAHKKFVDAGGALKRAAVDVREQANLKTASDLVDLHKDLQANFIDEAALELLKRGQPLPLDALSDAQKSMVAKKKLGLPRVPSAADAVADRSDR